MSDKPTAIKELTIPGPGAPMSVDGALRETMRTVNELIRRENERSSRD